VTKEGPASQYWLVVGSPEHWQVAARANGRDDSIFDYLTEQRDPSGFKYRIPFGKQVEMFRFAIDWLKPDIVPALCKEDKALWNALGLKFQGCHCLLGARDEIVGERRAEMAGTTTKSMPPAKTLLPVMA